MNPTFSFSRQLAWLPGVVGRLSAAVLALLVVTFFVLMIVGLQRWYTPVPFWDMWDAYIFAYSDFAAGGRWQGLFGQHTQHRIWFSNILFYIDLTFFEGRSVFLIWMNAILAVSTWLALVAIAWHLLKARPVVWRAAALCTGPLCFSWLQEQNLSWGFQSQFFAAYLFPLIAFACLARSFEEPRSRAWFCAALLFGLASLGTMANGIFVLPLLAAMLLAMPRPKWTHAAAVMAIAAVALTLWFRDYNFLETDRATVSQIITFVLTFLGLPFGAIVASEHLAFIGRHIAFASERAAYIAGISFILACAGFVVWWFRKRAVISPMALALVTFLGYIGISCAMIAMGRAAIQPNAALVSRYSTPSLIAWAALAVLLAFAFRNARFTRGSLLAVGILAAVGLSDVQRQVRGDIGPEVVHARLLGALALKLDIADAQSIGAIYPTNTKEAFDHVRDAARRAEKHNLSIMADRALTTAVTNLGRPAAMGFHACVGVLEETVPIDGEGRFHRAKGWVLDERSGRIPSFAYIVADGVVSGVVETGFPRPDVAAARDQRARYSGFTGYVLAPATGRELSIHCADDAAS